MKVIGRNLLIFAIRAFGMAGPSSGDVTGDLPATFPNTLEGFGYHFNSDGCLRNIKTDEPFQFKVSADDSYNQKHYEAIGEVLTQHVYQLLESECGLKKLYIPIKSRDGEPRTFVFVSDDALTNPDKLLLLIHGSGVVRAGQWSRRLIINDNLDCGTQLPFIKKAKAANYGIIVFNTNDNSYKKEDGKQEKIKGSETPEQHTQYVWENVVNEAAARHIAIIAHSYGGLCTINLVNGFEKAMRERVFAIAFTDSVHDLKYQNVSKSGVQWLQRVCCNWISSSEPLDKIIPTMKKLDVPRVSAGDKHHEMTSWSSFKSVFRFLSERYRDLRKPDVDAKSDL